MEEKLLEEVTKNGRICHQSNYIYFSLLHYRQKSDFYSPHFNVIQLILKADRLSIDFEPARNGGNAAPVSKTIGFKKFRDDDGIGGGDDVAGGSANQTKITITEIQLKQTTCSKLKSIQCRLSGID